MKWKIRLVIDVPRLADPVDRIAKLKKEGKIVQANIIDSTKFLIYYDNRKTTEAEILNRINSMKKHKVRVSDGEKLKEIING